MPHVHFARVECKAGWWGQAGGTSATPSWPMQAHFVPLIIVWYFWVPSYYFRFPHRFPTSTKHLFELSAHLCSTVATGIGCHNIISMSKLLVLFLYNSFILSVSPTGSAVVPYRLRYASHWIVFLCTKIEKKHTFCVSCIKSQVTSSMYYRSNLPVNIQLVTRVIQYFYQLRLHFINYKLYVFARVLI